MAEQQGFYINVDGQEIAVSDYINAGRTFGLAGDRMLANLLQMSVYDGTNVYKSAFPLSFGYPEGGGSGAPFNPGIITPAGASGSVTVNQFLALIGSRQTAGTSPTDPTWTGPRANLDDIRTSVWTGATTLAQTQALAANSSGNTRWDLLYATVSIDVASGSVVRRIKSATTSVVSVASEPTYLANPTTVAVVTGTPGASPTVPSLPADTGGNYNVALAAVRVPNGFTSGSTVSPHDIRDMVGNKNLGNGGGQTVALLNPNTGVMSGPVPATGNNDRAATYATNFPWTTSGGQRPGMFLPTGMTGGIQLLIEVDELTGTNSHANGSIVDDSIDWRSRFIITYMAGSSQKFANDPTIGAGFGTPSATGGNSGPNVAMSNTCVPFSGTLALVMDTSIYSGIAGGSASKLTVNMANGNLQWAYNGTPTGLRMFLWVIASNQFPNL